MKRPPEWVGPLAIAIGIMFICLVGTNATADGLENFGIALVAIVAGCLALALAAALLMAVFVGPLRLWIWIEDHWLNR